MAALTTMAIVGAAALGGAATVYGVNQQRKAAKEQKREMRKQQTAAKEASKLENTREGTGAKINLGRADMVNSGLTQAGGGGSDTTGSVASRVGGLKKRPSAALGL